MREREIRVKAWRVKGGPHSEGRQAKRASQVEVVGSMSE